MVRDMQDMLFPTKPTIQERFDKFDAEHPDVYELFKHYAWQLKQAGRTHFSSDAILHRIRWHHAINPDHDESFKLNDHFSSRYARKLISDEPEAFGGFFETRVLKS